MMNRMSSAKMTPAKQIILYTRQEFEIPAVIQKASLEDVEEILLIGTSVQQMIRSRRSNNEIQKVTEMKDAEIQRIQASYQEKLTKLLDELQSVSVEKERSAQEYSIRLKEAQVAEQEHVAKEYEERMRLLKRDHETLGARYAALEGTRQILEETRDREVQAAIRRTEEIMEKVVAAKEAELMRMQVAYERLSDTIARQSDELTKLAGNMGRRAANVKTKGSDYEEQFGEKLKKYYGVCGGFRLRDTRLGAGHECDFLMEMESHQIMWELKNYSAVVPKAEVDKFLRDLKENPQVSVGVMISRTTDIYGKHLAGPMLVEFEGDKMMIYLSQFEGFCGEDEGRVFQMFTALFRIWWEYHKEENQAFDRVELVRELERATEELGKRRTEWRRHKAHLEELSRWTMDLLEYTEARLDRVLKRARNQPEIQGVEVPVEFPEEVFRDSKEERDVMWMTSVMRMCEAGGEIEVRELVDLLGQQHKLSKDTIRTNLMSVVKDSAVFRKGVIKWIRGVSKKVAPCEIRQ